jgi:hypothetical protein
MFRCKTQLLHVHGKARTGGAQKNDDRGREWVLGATNYGIPGVFRILKACRAEKRGANQEPYGASLRLTLTDSAKDLSSGACQAGIVRRASARIYQVAGPSGTPGPPSPALFCN